MKQSGLLWLKKKWIIMVSFLQVGLQIYIEVEVCNALTKLHEEYTSLTCERVPYPCMSKIVPCQIP
jgi:hypothetical protein